MQNSGTPCRSPAAPARGAAAAARSAGTVPRPTPPHPAQRLLDAARHRLVRAGPVGVLDAQHVGAAERLPEQVVVDGGARAADVQEPGGRGREARAHRAGERRPRRLRLRRRRGGGVSGGGHGARHVSTR